MAVKYSVHILDHPDVVVEAEVINLGLNKLWFYDGQDNLLAVFVWRNILGFSSAGPIVDQRFTEELLHERKKPSKPE